MGLRKQELKHHEFELVRESSTGRWNLPPSILPVVVERSRPCSMASLIMRSHCSCVRKSSIIRIVGSSFSTSTVMLFPSTCVMFLALAKTSLTLGCVCSVHDHSC